jgi:hypothetical protein
MPVFVLAVLGCSTYERMDRPLPGIKATTLSGEELRRESFPGRPWIINLWAPW